MDTELHETQSDFSDTLKADLLCLGISAPELAKRLGVTKQCIYSYLNKQSMPTPAGQAQIQKILNDTKEQYEIDIDNDTGTTPSIPYHERLKEILNTEGLQPKELATLAGISTASVYNYQNGVNKPTPSIASKISKVLGYTLQEMGYVSLTMPMQRTKIEQTLVNTFAERLADILKKRDESPRELAFRIGMHPMSIRYYLDKRGLPTRKNAEKLAKALQTDLITLGYPDTKT